MTPATLRQLGNAVWGDLWRAELARALGRNLATVRRWGRVGRMSRKDHFRILEAAKLHSKGRHKIVLGLVASIKSRPITGCWTAKRTPKVKDPIPPWKNDPQQLVATREFFANHARPEAFYLKPRPVIEHRPETVALAPMPSQPPLETRREEKKSGWVVETGGR